MVVSHRYRFIFIKTRKTAGTSIEVFLSQQCAPDDILTPIIPHHEPHRPRNYDGFGNHSPASDVRARLGTELWNAYFRFCVERNPWDKTLSYYFMKKFREGGGLSFDAYLEQNDFCVDHPLYTEPGQPDTLIVNRVLRYERLEHDLTQVFRELGVPFSGTLDVRAKSEYRNDRRPYQALYTPSQARRVEAAFAKELELFGYSF